MAASARISPFRATTADWLVGQDSLSRRRIVRQPAMLAKDAWGRGFATEALGAMVEIARASGVSRLYALCHVDHRPSAHVLEKCGFTCEGTLRQYAEFPNLSRVNLTTFSVTHGPLRHGAVRILAR